jgi:hypothetical protein
VQDDNTEVFNAHFFELALFVSEVQLVFAQMFHDNVGDRAMFFQRRHEDEDVIKVDGDDALGDEVLDRVVCKGDLG